MGIKSVSTARGWPESGARCKWGGLLSRCGGRDEAVLPNGGVSDVLEPEFFFFQLKNVYGHAVGIDGRNGVEELDVFVVVDEVPVAFLGDKGVGIVEIALGQAAIFAEVKGPVGVPSGDVHLVAEDKLGFPSVDDAFEFATEAEQGPFFVLLAAAHPYNEGGYQACQNQIFFHITISGMLPSFLTASTNLRRKIKGRKFLP